ncbi:hypothetical protein GGR52DRAFT_529095 [Hypoxylon sp. FL1284]|nr:hypothetical protein GGR52DRAFT_529095 [Hypoxylon sp. FL1284]
MASGVPTHRQFLTSLIDSLTSIPTPPPSTTTAPPSAPNTNSNPLKRVPAACRPLLTTLYALYPLILLPALDLLDRRLVTRVFVSPPQQQAETGGRPDAEDKAADETADTGGRSPAHRSSSYYVVRSAQPEPRRHGRVSGGTAPAGPSYVVRLAAWNCTCAAFAFAAFPREDAGSGLRSSSHVVVDEPAAASKPRRSSSNSRPGGTEEEDVEVKKGGREKESWEFGALSADGREGSGIAGVPCCKHLLACLLAERWAGLLGGYVEERTVGREEGAGLIADI